MNNLQMDMRGQGSGDKKSSNIKARLLIMARDLVKLCRKLLNMKNNSTGLLKKAKLDNAGKFRSICFIDPDDMEFKHTMKNAVKKLELLLKSASRARFKNFGTEKLVLKMIPLLADQNTHASWPRIYEKAHW